MFTPSYQYWQYSDDQDVKDLFFSINELLKANYDAINNWQPLIYTDFQGIQLDYVALGVYGFSRPVITVGDYVPAFSSVADTQIHDIIPTDYYIAGVSPDFMLCDDDAFKRLIMWHTYKGDGDIFSIDWLKRRIKRFIETDIFNAVNDTHDISIGTPPRKMSAGGSGCDAFLHDKRPTDLTVNSSSMVIDDGNIWTITIYTTTQTARLANIFKWMLAGGFLDTPRFYRYKVILL